MPDPSVPRSARSWKLVIGNSVVASIQKRAERVGLQDPRLRRIVHVRAHDADVVVEPLLDHDVDEDRNAVGQRALLVGHRARIVHHEQHIERPRMCA